MDEKSSIDQFDISLLQHLQNNSRSKNTELAKQLNVTEGAIRKRIARLRKLGVIEKFTIQLSDKSQGIRAIVEIQIDGNEKPSKIRGEIVERIPRGVEMIYELTGDVDMITIFHTSNHDELGNAIENLRQIPGIRNTKTHVILKRTKLPNLIF
ncbi:MAG: HTH-type transcriptional regulator LysM [Candidatus Heimdallarchaeota archaeon LC_2]|nr:MAG: HTH-type transcriptional regulator LysM [Candidatus Heimdallarchaeota archaeon LC_2]